MDAQEVKRIRQSLGLTLAQLAAMFRVDPHLLHEMETGDMRCSGPLSVLLELLDQGYIDHLRPDEPSA